MQRSGVLATARVLAMWVLASCVLSACSQSGPLPLTGQPSLHTAQAALETGAPDMALNICSRLVSEGRGNATVFVCQGDALAALGRPAEADTSYTQALALDPRSIGGLVGLGRLRLATDPARAEQLFMQALAQNPRAAAALNDLGIARDLQGRHAEAQQAYGAAIAADPDMRAAQVNLALSVGLQGRPDEAVRLMQPLVGRADTTARERHDLAAVLAMDGRVAEATRLLSPDLQGADLDAAIAGYRALLVAH
jgi:Flp pilus assembly protein TadD